MYQLEFQLVFRNEVYSMQAISLIILPHVPVWKEYEGIVFTSGKLCACR